MLNSYKRLFSFVLVLFILGFFVWGAEVQLSLEIKGLGIRHGTPGNLNLGTVISVGQEQEITGVFDNYFRVEDFMGLITGHYTTIQSNGLYGPNGSIITGIYLKEGSTNPVLILGKSGEVLISNNLSNYKSIYNPIVYIYKPTVKSNAGIGNRYGDDPTIKVVVPPNTTPGDYSGTIVFTLYMNEN